MSARGFAEGWRRYEAENPLPTLAVLPAAVAAAGAEVSEAIRKAADAHLAGRFTALGRDWPRRWPGTTLSPDYWRIDPVTGRLWPGSETFTFSIGQRHGRHLGPIRYVWEVNRLQMLQPLAAEVLLSGDMRAIAAIEEILASWQAANPPFRGVAWRSGRECALRTVSLLVVSSLAGPKLSADTGRRLAAMIAAHVFWLDRFSTSGPSAETTRLAVASAEFLISCAEPRQPSDEVRGMRARRALEDGAQRLIQADGTSFDTSPNAGAFAAELLLLASIAADSIERPLAAFIKERLVQFARFVGWIADHGGSVPAIGEDEDNRVLSIGYEAPYAMSVARAIVAHTRRDIAGLVAGPANLRDAVARTSPASTPAPLGLETFDSGGLSVLRESRAGRDLTLILDHGRDGPHEDGLSILVAVDGRALLADSGPAVVHKSNAVRTWSRSRRAHNTLNVDEAGDTEVARALNWLHGAQGRLESSAEGERWHLEAGYDGFKARHGVRHQRTLEATDDGFVLRDRLIGSDAPLRVEIAFHLASDVEAQREDRIVTLTWPARSLAPVQIAFDTPGDIVLTRAGQSGAGWVSPSYGLKHPAWRLSWRGRIASTGSRIRMILG